MRKDLFTIHIHEDLTEEDGRDLVAAIRLLGFIAARHKGNIAFVGDKPDGTEVLMPTATADLDNAQWFNASKDNN